jgi:3-hydroxyisobutyrate dehydrogenase
MNTLNQKIGFIGMGLMGIPMSLRLINAGYSVTVWNRSPEKSAFVAAKGAVQAGSIAELTTQSDIIMLSVSDTRAVEEVVFGEQCVASAGGAPKILVDFSSIAPDATRLFASKLNDIIGMPWIDAPVSGGVAGAEQGTLAIMAGGDATLIDNLRPILAHLSQRVTHMGPVGSGQATKIGNQMIVSCNVLVIAEVLALLEKAGVDSTKIPEALKGGFADSIPLQLTGSRMVHRDFDDIKWRIKTLLKDLNMASELADQVNGITPMSELGKMLMQRYNDQGLAEHDPATLIECYAQK